MRAFLYEIILLCSSFIRFRDKTGPIMDNIISFLIKMLHRYYIFYVSFRSFVVTCLKRFLHDIYCNQKYLSHSLIQFGFLLDIHLFKNSMKSQFTIWFQSFQNCKEHNISVYIGLRMKVINHWCMLQFF